MTVIYWARHGENSANLSRRFSYRVYDGDAHGASIRAAVPVPTGQADPGADLVTGALARFTVTRTPAAGGEITLASWTY